MKELVFTKAGRLSHSIKGALRLTVHFDKSVGMWIAEVQHRVSGRKLDRCPFMAKSQAIDWLARYRVPETKETVE